MNFLIRADASLETGSGHVMRVLGLAQELKREGHNVCFLHACPESLRDRLTAQGLESLDLDAIPGSSEDAESTVHRARVIDADWVIADGYDYSAAYQQAIMTSGFRMLLADDNGHADGYPADLILNQTVHANPSLYANWHDDGRFLLGPQYALLRAEFRPWIGQTRVVRDTPKRLLVSLGGLPDPDWLSRVLRGLSGLDLEISVAGGIPDSARDDVAPDDLISLLPHVENMADLIARCDIGLTAGGAATREFLFLGLPFAVVDVAENQVLQSQYLDDHGIALRLGPIDTLDTSTILGAISRLVESRADRIQMSAAGQRLVDGRGVDRVVARLLTPGRRP